MHALVLVTAGLAAGSRPPDSGAEVAYQPMFTGCGSARGGMTERPSLPGSAAVGPR